MYKEKYIKYKTKYLDLQSQTGGFPIFPFKLTAAEKAAAEKAAAEKATAVKATTVKATTVKAAAEKAAGEKVVAENTLTTKAYDKQLRTTINLTKKINPKITDQEITTAIKEASVNFKKAIIKGTPETQAAYKQYIQELNSEVSLQIAMIRVRNTQQLNRVQPIITGGYWTEWDIVYALKRQKETDPSFIYNEDERSNIEWTGWTNLTDKANKYNENKLEYYINPGNGEIIEKTLLDITTRQQSLSQSERNIEDNKAWESRINDRRYALV